MDPWIATPAQLAAALDKERVKYGRIIKAANVTAGS
jgi:tripartite-type tricarboxylate transporter receptor subunit TctC